MEYILMALFGGGTLDWEDLGKTEYDWEEIFDDIKDNFGSLDNIEINDLYFAILQRAKSDFVDLINNFINEYKDNENYKNEVEILSNFDFDDEENWEISCNCLATRISLFTTQEVIDTFEEVALDSDIENINDKIGFTYINIEER